MCVSNTVLVPMGVKVPVVVPDIVGVDVRVGMTLVGISVLVGIEVIV